MPNYRFVNRTWYNSPHLYKRQLLCSLNWLSSKFEITNGWIYLAVPYDSSSWTTKRLKPTTVWIYILYLQRSLPCSPTLLIFIGRLIVVPARRLEIRGKISSTRRNKSKRDRTKSVRQGPQPHFSNQGPHRGRQLLAIRLLSGLGNVLTVTFLRTDASSFAK